MTDLFDVDWSELPEPQDDGGADHLIGMALPQISLCSTTGERVILTTLKDFTVLYAYPMTGTSGAELPDGWDMLPGARGCTPQACAFRDHAGELRDRGVRHIFGISTQSTREQGEAAERIHLPFGLLSDADLEFCSALRLPTFTVDSRRFMRRLTLIVRDGRVVEKFYRVFPPDEAPSEVLKWLSERGSGPPK